MLVTWVDGTRVLYVLEPHSLSGHVYWTVHKQVPSAANPAGYVVGTSDDLDRAKRIAEVDAGRPL